MTKFNEIMKLQEMLGRGTPVDTSMYHVGNGGGIKTGIAGAVGGGAYGTIKSVTAKQTAENLKSGSDNVKSGGEIPSLQDRLRDASGPVGKINHNSDITLNHQLSQHTFTPASGGHTINASAPAAHTDAAAHAGSEHTTGVIDHIHNAFSSAKSHIMDLVHNHPLAAGVAGGAAATYGVYKLGKKIFGGER